MRVPGRLVRGRIRPDRWTALRFASMRWAALPVIDRRWTAPLSAIALGFGLFVGVAIGPGTQGSLGTTRPVMVQVPDPDAQTTVAAASPSPGGGSHLPGTGQGGHASPTRRSTRRRRRSPPIDSSSFRRRSGPHRRPPSFPTTPTTTIPPVDNTGGTTTTDQTQTGDETSTTTTFTGTVVHLNPKAGSYTLAADGELIAIHSGHLPDIGETLEVDTLTLANGTYGEDGDRERSGKRGRASLGGVVTFRDPRTGIFTLSATGASVLVRGGAQRTPPPLGKRADVEVRFADHPEELPIAPGGSRGLREAAGAPEGTADLPRAGRDRPHGDEGQADDGSTADIEAIVEGVCRSNPRKLVVSADDLRESGQDIPVACRRSSSSRTSRPATSSR